MDNRYQDSATEKDFLHNIEPELRKEILKNPKKTQAEAILLDISSSNDGEK